MADRPSAATTEDPNAAAAALAYEQQYAQCKYLCLSLLCFTRLLQRLSRSLYSTRLVYTQAAVTPLTIL